MTWRLLMGLLALCLWLAQPLVAQEAPDYEAWERLAERAEAVIEVGRASNAALEALRSQIVEYRTEFLDATGINGPRIETVTQQIAALGPAPEEGATEEPQIAARRAILEEQLSRLQAPVFIAEEAHSRANGLVGEIDQIIRDRQADRLFEIGPSPLWPERWLEAIEYLSATTSRVGQEISTAWRTEAQMAQLRRDVPGALLLFVVAGVLLLRGRDWMETLATRFIGRGEGVWTALISLGQIILPMIGVFALTTLLLATGLFGFRGQVLVEAIPAMGFTILFARWLAGRVFPKNVEAEPLVDLPPDKLRNGRQITNTLGTLLALSIILTEIANFEDYSQGAVAAIALPFQLAVAWLLYRMARLLRISVQRKRDADPEGNQLRVTLLSLLSTSLIVVSVVGPVLALIGYTWAADALMGPAIMTLALIAVLLLLHRLVSGIYALASGKGEAARDSLTPVLINSALTLAATPILALIWGARVTDLTEIWSNFLEGFQIGETRISPTDFVVFGAIFLVGFLVTRLIQGVLRSSVLPKTRVDLGGRNAIVSGMGYVGIFLAALIAITATGLDLSSIALVAGALSVGIGFGLQNIVSNFISGIILLIERPISEGDWIEVGGQMGYVRSISVRSTRIETFDRTDVIVPNADLISGTVTNWTRGNSVGRAIVPVGVAYGTDTKKVEGILREVAEAHPMVLLNPAPAILFQGFGADSLDFEIRAILRDVNWVLSVKSEMNHEINRRFAEEGIEIPFAQRDLWLRNPEVLRDDSSVKTNSDDQ